MVTYEAFAFASLEAAEAPKAQPHTKVWGALWSAFQYTPTRAGGDNRYGEHERPRMTKPKLAADARVFT